MTLKDVIRTMEVVASRQPSVGMIVENDIFRLNTYADARYGVFAFVQGQHRGNVDTSLMDYSFSLFYVDRLTDSATNQIDVQSEGISVLDNILRQLDGLGLWVSEYSVQTFGQRFLDECAGVFCNVTISAPVSGICGEAYADFNNDFDDDFLII